MPSRFLSDEQRARYGRYAGDPTEEQLARHFYLDAADRELVGQMRGAHNRIGFAIQLGTARFLGAFLDDPSQTPPMVIVTMARQIGEASAPDLEAYRDGRQRWRHAAIIRGTPSICQRPSPKAPSALSEILIPNGIFA